MLSSSVTNAQTVPTVSTFEKKNTGRVQKPKFVGKNVMFPDKQFKILDPERNYKSLEKQNEDKNENNNDKNEIINENGVLNNSHNFDEVETPYHLLSLSPSNHRNDSPKNKLAYILTLVVMCGIFVGLWWICRKLLFGPEKNNTKKMMKGGGNSDSVSESSTINQNIDQILNSF